MGMFGIKQFEAVINPPQGMIMAIGAGEKRPYVINDSLQIATRDERHRQLRPPRHRRRRRGQADAGVQAAGRKSAGDAGLSREAVIRVTAMPADTQSLRRRVRRLADGPDGPRLRFLRVAATGGKAILVAADASSSPVRWRWVTSSACMSIN